MVKKVVILASGEGTNLQEVIDKKVELFNVDIVGVVSNLDSKALERAKENNISYFYFPWNRIISRTLFIS